LTTSLSGAEEKFRALAEHAPDVILRFDRNLSHLYVNPAGLRMYGKPADAVIGKPIDRLGLDESYSAVWKERIQEVFRSGRPSEVEDSLPGPEGMESYQSHCVPEFGSDGAVANVLVVSRDVTGRKKAEDAMQRSAENLRRSNEDLQQFAYAVSHDLQEPLRMVSGFLRLLEERYQPQLDERARKYISYAVEGATRMSQLITDLLAYSRVDRQAKELQPTDANASLASALSNLRTRIEEASATISHDELPIVLADGSQLVQLFQNLIGNAIKFRNIGRSCRVDIGALKQDSEYVFSVCDNGIGIAEEDFDRIFTIFQRLHAREKYEGTGVGLAICKRIVERHGGRVWVESRLGEGSRFRFTLKADK
jgi:PAS domain S-box-containing protein